MSFRSDRRSAIRYQLPERSAVGDGVRIITTSQGLVPPHHAVTRDTFPDARWRRRIAPYYRWVFRRAKEANRPDM